MTPEPTIASTIEQFRESVTPDLYEVTRFIDWPDIEARVTRYESAIRYLQDAGDSDGIDAGTLQRGFTSEPYLYEVATTLLAIPKGAIGFSDGRELPEPSGRPTTRLKEVSGLLIDLGFSRLVKPGESVVSLVRLALVGQDAARRRYRVGATIAERLKSVLETALAQAVAHNDVVIERAAEATWPQAARGKAQYVLAVGARQSIAVASVFQTASGGRQQSELSQTFPNLQRELAEYGLNLILVADGRGVRDAREPVLRAMFSGVASCMTFRQAADGHLLAEIIRLIATEPPSQERRALKSIIHEALTSQIEIAASALPTDLNRASLSLATYKSENPTLDLNIDATGSRLSWAKGDLVSNALGLTKAFVPTAALQLVSRMLGASLQGIDEHQSPLAYSVGTLEIPDGALPPRLLLTASPAIPSIALAKQVASLALVETPDAKVALFLSPTLPDETAAVLRRLQSSLTSNIVVITSHQLLAMARARESGGAFIARILLEQSDLTKASPFVVNSVTPSRMFYGREGEEASLVSTLNANSVALLGGRRIGKTSLMRHAASRLRDGGFETFFGDCQTVRDWPDFADMAKRVWGVTLDQSFRPARLFELVQQLRPAANTKIVILLDEIDQLLDWDKRHTVEQVPEAFFRACRTVSQQAEAQFVFSGERTIAGRLWDPQSPHWNFCQPLMLRQLEQSAAHQLLLRPLRTMQITIEDEHRFSSVAWSRTSGHPQLLQTLGDRLVHRLNEKASSLRATVSPDDLLAVADTYSYAEHYLETYWGQATSLERLLTVLVATGTSKLETCRDFLRENNVERSDDEIRSGLRMIELYGVTDSNDSGYQLRLEWFLSAIGFYGTAEKLIEQYKGALT